NAVLELERVTRRPSEPGEDRKSAVGDLTAAVLERLQRLQPDKMDDLLTAMRDLVSERHVQMLSFNPVEQAAIRAAGADGAVSRTADDFVSVNEASVMGGKVSLILERSATHTIDFSE